MPASAGGTVCPAPRAAATTISASAAGSSDGAATSACATGSSQSSATECSIDTCAPFFAACRRRCAISG